MVPSVAFVNWNVAGPVTAIKALPATTPDIIGLDPTTLAPAEVSRENDSVTSAPPKIPSPAIHQLI
ncbi:hypothetical protein D3C71_2140780 [compost metagenome]